MLHDNRTKCCSHLASLQAYAVFGRKHIMEVAEQMMHETDALPADLKPLGEAMTQLVIQVLTESYAESLHLIAELGFQEIIQAAQAPNNKHEKE
jgi:hypothetical protein